MGWQDLLAKPDDSVTIPWVGGRDISHKGRRWQIDGRTPREHGWYEFNVQGGRKARLKGPTVVDPSEYFSGVKLVQGYMVGDRILPDGFTVIPDPSKLLEQSQTVHLLEEGLPRFSRVSASYHDGNLIFVRQEFPLGPESQVLEAFQDRKPFSELRSIREVTPALELAFRFEGWLRERNEGHLRLLAEQRRIEEEARAVAERRQALVERLGDGASRREMARIDFGEAARAALAVGGAELLDWRNAHGRGGAKVVQFRYRNRRFECVCDETMHIIESGICLVGNDGLFTLESLPPTIGEAIDTGVLHVFRRLDGEEDD